MGGSERIPSMLICTHSVCGAAGRSDRLLPLDLLPICRLTFDAGLLLACQLGRHHADLPPPMPDFSPEEFVQEYEADIMVKVEAVECVGRTTATTALPQAYSSVARGSGGGGLATTEAAPHLHSFVAPPAQ